MNKLFVIFIHSSFCASCRCALVLLCCMLFFMSGCANDYQNTSDLRAESSQRSWDATVRRLEANRARVDKALEAQDTLLEKEATFISGLDDKQLYQYGLFSTAYQIGDLAAKELVRRQLEQCLDADRYNTAIQIVEDKYQLSREMDAIKRSLEEQHREAEEKSKRAEEEMRRRTNMMLSR